MKITARCLGLLLPLAAVAAAVLTSGCAANRQEAASGWELVAGGLYSIDDGEGSFRVAKILVLDETAVHVAIYGNKFSARPTTIDPASLSYGSIEDGDEGIGIMHLPLSREAFARDRPVFITSAPVTEAELEGYRMWEEAGGEVFP